MSKDSIIKAIIARQVVSEREYPGIEATVLTEDGSQGVAVVSGGHSVGEHEVKFVYDGGEKWGGRGVTTAIRNITEIIGPALIGVDSANQSDVDNTLIELDGTPNKSRLGGNSTASVSAAALKAGAASTKTPLYRHIGGRNACMLPVPGVICLLGSTRYGGGKKSGGKPSYAFMCYGFDTFSEASEACWQVKRSFTQLLQKKWDFDFSGTVFNRIMIQAGIVDHDRHLWELMTEAIGKSNFREKVGIQVDVAATTYYDWEKGKYVGLFSGGDKTKDDLITLYKEMVKTYPFVIIEDPLHEEDYEGHTILTRELGIQLVGDDLFSTNIERLRHGIELKACNTILLKVNQIGTITEAFETVRFAQSRGYGVMPCSSRGEGVDIADYAVGLGAGTIRESGLDPTANRLLQIEAELGNRAMFQGKNGLKFGGVQ